MAKVKCKVCDNEVAGICNIKKIGVKINKDRICEGYIYNVTKMKSKQGIPVIRINCAEYEEERKRLKAERAEIRRFKATTSNNNVDSQVVYSIPGDVNSKYPITGDLSRFVSSAISDKK